jgi:hypothetical protein
LGSSVQNLNATRAFACVSISRQIVYFVLAITFPHSVKKEYKVSTLYDLLKHVYEEADRKRLVFFVLLLKVEQLVS